MSQFVGAIIANKFQVKKKIGSGSFGEIFLGIYNNFLNSFVG